jgi:hypothetical protein
MASLESRTRCSGGRRCCLARSCFAGTVGMTHCLNVWRIISWCVPRSEELWLERVILLFLCACVHLGRWFIAYAVILAILLLVGEAWVRRSGRSPDWWDSWVILLWVRVLCCVIALLVRCELIALFSDRELVRFCLPSCLFLPRSAQIPLSLYFRSFSQHVYRAPRQCVVGERHAAYVRL